MSPNPFPDLSRRERQVLDLVFELGAATVGELHERLPDFPSYDAVRAVLGALADKGHVRHQRDGRRYVYLPTQRPERARTRALDHLVQTLFDGSTSGVVSTLLDLRGGKLSDAEYDELTRMIAAAKKQRRRKR